MKFKPRGQKDAAVTDATGIVKIPRGKANPERVAPEGGDERVMSLDL